MSGAEWGVTLIMVGVACGFLSTSRALMSGRAILRSDLDSAERHLNQSIGFMLADTALAFCGFILWLVAS